MAECARYSLCRLRKTSNFEPEKFEDHYETLSSTSSIKSPPESRSRRRSDRAERTSSTSWRLCDGAGAAAELSTPKKSKKPRKTAAGQKEMLMPIAGKKQAKETAVRKPAAKPPRKSA